MIQDGQNGEGVPYRDGLPVQAPSPDGLGHSAGIPSADRPTSWFNEESDGSGVAGFMCLTDFECEVGAAAGGNKVFPSIDDLRRCRSCADSCGIAEVRVVGVKIVQPAKDYDFSDAAKAIEARSDKTGTSLAEGESAAPQGFAQTQSGAD